MGAVRTVPSPVTVLVILTMAGLFLDSPRTSGEPLSSCSGPELRGLTYTGQGLPASALGTFGVTILCCGGQGV